MREQKDRYEIFLKVCETGSFSKAAEALNYTQSGISQMMAGLEEELGVQLFARINRGVTLTDNGTRLLPYIRELANQKNRLRQAAFNINHKVEGKLRVGSFSSITTLWMPEVVHYFKENYPKVSIEILDGNYDEIREWIIHGQVDCGFLSSIVADDLKFYPLRDDPLCAVFPEGHPLAVQPSGTLPQLFQDPLIIETPGCDNDIQHLIDIPAVSGSPPSLPSWKTPAPASGSRQVPADGTPHRGSRMPASPVLARWSRPARCARTP